MEPIDKCGNQIYPKIYSILCEIAIKLKNIGYIESKKEPNLFIRSFENGCIFADLRGTKLVRIWDDPVPLITFHFENSVPNWKRHRVINDTYSELDDYAIRWRDLTDIDESWMDWPSELIYWSNVYGPYDGSCKTCNLDIQKDDYFCSESCKEIALKKLHAISISNTDEYCYVCYRKKTPSADDSKILLNIELPEVLINHHISYFPEKTITVCGKCHNEIHHTSKYPDLKPKPGDSTRFYNK